MFIPHLQLLLIIIHVPITVTREWSVWMWQVAIVMDRPRRRAAPCFTGGPEVTEKLQSGSHLQVSTVGQEKCLTQHEKYNVT